MPQPESPPPPPPPLRLFNAFAKSPEPPAKCYYTVPESVHTYFYRKLFPGEHGIYQNLISPFISKLYDECKRRGLDGERACWDKTNESIVAGILRDLNFRAEPSEIRPKVPVSKRGPRKRRSAVGSDESKG